jgi:parallel beta-helix repeat protein
VKHIIALSASLVCATTFAADITIYVAIGGNDKLTGSAASFDRRINDGPVATLQRARDLVREMRKGGAGPRARIFLRGGTHYLNSTLQLDKEDSGTDSAPLVITGYRKERPIVSGGARLIQFGKYKDAILFGDVAHERFKNRRIRQAFIDGEALTLARYPNVDHNKPISGGWSYVDGVITWNQLPNINESKRLLRIKPADLRKWSSIAGAEVFVFPRYNWINDIIPVDSLDDTGLIKLKHDASYDIRPGDRYFVQNLLAELDSPGEWFFDSKQARIYFWPKSNFTKTSEVVISNIETLINVKNANGIHIRGLTLEVAEGSAIKLDNSSNCVVAANIIRQVGLRGGNIFGIAVHNGNNNRIVGNDVSSTGGGGIFLTGGEERELKSASHLAENNYIHHTGMLYKQGVAIELAGVGNVVRRNFMHDLPRMGILVDGNDHVIELNRIHHTNLETVDSGAIYTSGRDWLSPRGVVIRHNEILDTVGFGYEFKKQRWTTHHFTFGIYLDDNSSGVDIIGNVIGRASWAGVFVRSGSYNNIVNNIIFDNVVNQVFLQGFGDGDPFRKLAREKHSEFTKYPAWKKYRGFVDSPPDATKSASNISFQRNLVVYSAKASKYAKITRFDIESSHINNNAISSRDAEISIDDGSKSGLSWDDWRRRGLDTDSILISDGVIASDVDWGRLNSSAVMRKIGFQPIPFDKIGPYQSADRASWPIVEVKSVRETIR